MLPFSGYYFYFPSFKAPWVISNYLLLMNRILHLVLDALTAPTKFSLNWVFAHLNFRRISVSETSVTAELCLFQSLAFLNEKWSSTSFIFSRIQQFFQHFATVTSWHKLRQLLISFPSTVANLNCVNLCRNMCSNSDLCNPAQWNFFHQFSSIRQTLRTMNDRKRIYEYGILRVCLTRKLLRSTQQK